MHACHGYPYTDAPSLPQALRSRVLESGTDYSTIEVTWEPPGNDSRVDFYQYQVVDSSEGASVSYQANTTNTTAILFCYGINISFVLIANNCEGTSAPVTYAIYIGKYNKHTKMFIINLKACNYYVYRISRSRSFRSRL